MFERYNRYARRVIADAQEEARAMDQPGVGPEHILLALTRDGLTKTTHVLTHQGASGNKVRRLVRMYAGAPARGPAGELPFTPLATTALEQAVHAANLFGQHEIWSEHLLLALTRQGDGIAHRVLTELGAIDGVRRTLLQGLAHMPDTKPAAGGANEDPGTERFNDQLRRILVDARSAAERMGHHHVGPDHFLFAMTRDMDTAVRVKATQVLRRNGFGEDDARRLIRAYTPASTGVFLGRLPFTTQAEAVLEEALRLADSHDHRQVSAEHLLLAITRLTEGAAFTVLTMLCNIGDVSAELVHRLTFLEEDPAPDVPAGAAGA